MLFGPGGQTLTGTVSGRVQFWGAASGKRFPWSSGVGAYEIPVQGFKLMVIPAQGILELRKGDDSKISVPYAWKSQTWTRLRIHISKAGRGEVSDRRKSLARWVARAAGLGGFRAGCRTAIRRVAGASAWGMPYSGKPIRFDDLGYDPQ